MKSYVELLPICEVAGVKDEDKIKEQLIKKEGMNGVNSPYLFLSFFGDKVP
jgi:hypothetical protein